jgi:hypothetical protein
MSYVRGEADDAQCSTTKRPQDHKKPSQRDEPGSEQDWERNAHLACVPESSVMAKRPPCNEKDDADQDEDAARDQDIECDHGNNLVRA